MYLLQWKDCQNDHSYRRRKVISFVSVRIPLQVEFDGDFDGDFVTYHASYLRTQFTFSIVMWHCETIFPFYLLCFGGGRGRDEL